ncbi:hypothetical protein RHGRI_001024 [Rhododendron griersonianum]|uniref:MOSC domain-containing protein n=1 Tax=Rhododendron griersonianum TaxID=479676 RepID=A0AAV6LL94_9ERIC|nr:hypothetical protein RHGRI_001024 [Rhododendron griersonianum]
MFSNNSPDFKQIQVNNFMLVANVQESLEGPPIQVNPMRFRPNLVISGGAPYAENEWRSLKIGNEIFLSFGACNRCQMINLNHQEGEVRRSREPLATLASYRRVKGTILFAILLRYDIDDEVGQDMDSWLQVGQKVHPNTEEIKGTLGYSSILQEGEVGQDMDSWLQVGQKVHPNTDYLIQLWCCPPRADSGRKLVGEFGDSMDIGGGSRRQYRSLLNGYPLTSVVNLFKIAIMCVEDESVDRPTTREVVHMLTNPPQSATAPPLFTLQYFGAATFSWRGMHSCVRSRGILLLFPSWVTMVQPWQICTLF